MPVLFVNALCRVPAVNISQCEKYKICVRMYSFSWSKRAALLAVSPLEIRVCLEITLSLVEARNRIECGRFSKYI